MTTATPEKIRQAAPARPAPARDRENATPPPVVALEYLDNAAAAAWLGVSPENLRKSRSTGSLCGCEPPEWLRLGVKGRVRYSVDELRRWMAEHTTPHAAHRAAAGQ